MLDAEGPDSPETFTGDTIDVGALAEEFFGLAIDPYPRSQALERGTSPTTRIGRRFRICAKLAELLRSAEIRKCRRALRQATDSSCAATQNSYFRPASASPARRETVRSFAA